MIHFYRVMALAVLLLPVCLSAQERITAQPVSPETVPALKNIFKKYALFEFNTQALNQTVKKAAAGGDINLEFDLPGYNSFPINMHQHDILSTDYKLVVGAQQGRQEFPRPDCMTYSGVLTGQGNSDVRLTITSDLIYGILTGNNKSWFIEPVWYLNNQVKENLYVVYETTDVIPKTGINCGVSEVMTRVSTLNISNARVEGTATGICKLIELGIASDDSMFYRYRTADNVQAHNIAAANSMAGFYGNTQIGSYYLDFVINGQYVSAAANANALSPLTTTQNSSILLDNFKTWGEAGNFGFNYDIGVYWTTKDMFYTIGGINNAIVGLSYNYGACGYAKYQILTDFSGAGADLAVLEAHETGHNLGASHDASDAPYIMAPSINGANYTFSTASITAMLDFISSPYQTCFSPCSNTFPTAQFIASQVSACLDSSITFTNYTPGLTTGISWTFQDGNPATSTARSPAVTFSTPGYKTVKLVAYNANGSTTVTRQVFIGSNIGNGCSNIIAGNGNYGALQSFSLKDISLWANPVRLGYYYENAACNKYTVLQPGTTYSASFGAGFLDVNYDVYSNFQMFIDYNNDGDFLDTDEAIYNSPSAIQDYSNFIFTTPAKPPVMDSYLRLRIIGLANGMAYTNGCSIPNNSNIYDFGVMLSSSDKLPWLITSFDGYYDNGKNDLYWKTETEVNTAHFIVERSINGTEYVEVGKVPATGISGMRINYYRFTDALVNADDVNRFYYRLKIVDKDYSYKYSKLVITNRSEEGSPQVLVYPNPVMRSTTLQIKKAINNLSVIEVFNSMGQRVYSKRLAVNMYNISIDIPGNWSAGIYMIRVSDSKVSWSRAVMIK